MNLHLVRARCVHIPKLLLAGSGNTQFMTELQHMSLCHGLKKKIIISNMDRALLQDLKDLWCNSPAGDCRGSHSPYIHVHIDTSTQLDARGHQAQLAEQCALHPEASLKPFLPWPHSKLVPLWATQMWYKWPPSPKGSLLVSLVVEGGRCNNLSFILNEIASLPRLLKLENLQPCTGSLQFYEGFWGFKLFLASYFSGLTSMMSSMQQTHRTCDERTKSLHRVIKEHWLRSLGMPHKF